ncbi:MAG: helicase-exonuclease AddAB subunit AddB [Clostridium sp.]|uniref:helicase-exonuclease AddAB subunit AddB n=1 Tax=Clostridium sp. TaxID=1506 RepID=UPI003EE7645A
MGIRFVYGRAGSGKSTFCLNQIKEKIKNNENNKLIVIVPEQYTFQREKDLLKLAGERALLRAEVLSFKRMGNRVFDDCGGRVHKIIKDEGKNMLIYKLLQEKGEDLSYFNRISKKQGFVDIISKTITEFKKYNISKEILLESVDKVEDKDLKDKLVDLASIFDEYNSRIEKKVIDGDDELTILANKLKVCNLYEGAEIWIDEFTTFTPQQLEIIKELSKKAKEINITLCSENTGNKDEDITDIFNAIKSTENKVIKMMEENNIGYLEPIDLNKGVPYRFRESKELAHLERYFFTYPFKIYNEELNGVRMYRANNTYDEVDTIAKDIVSLVRDKGLRYKDIAVICRNINDYEKIVSVIFEQYNIPYFLDKKIQVLSNPIVILIMSALEISITNWSYESVFKYLKSGLINIDREFVDKLENYVLAHGIKGYKWTTEDVNDGFFEKNGEISKEDLEIKDIMENIRESLMNFHNKIKGKKSVIQICTAIYEFLVELNIFKKVDEWIKNFEEEGLEGKVMEYEQVPNIIMEILDQAVEVMGEDKISIKDFYKVLNSGFESKEIGVIPVALDQVNIGDIARVKGREVKSLYIIGVNDGVLPSASKEEGIISDRDRDTLKEIDVDLASTTKARAFEEQYMVYTALTIASERMMITYPMADFEGKSLRASIIIPRLKRVLSKLKEESEIIEALDKEYKKITTPIPTFNELVLALRKQADDIEIEDYWAEVYKWFTTREVFNDKARSILEGINYTNLENEVSREKLIPLYENKFGELRFNVSRLEQYAGCPFSYFVKYGLKARDRKIYEFSAPDLGSFMHDVLDNFTSKVRRENISWGDLNREKCRKIVDELVNIKLQEDSNSILNSSKRYKYFTGRFKRVITKSISVIAEQIKRGEFEVFSNEFSFGENGKGAPIELNLPTGENVYLTGRIDRIDSLTIDGMTYLRVVDYKSSAKKFDLAELFAGIQMQLLVYIDALIRNSKYILDGNAMPGAILYFKIDDPILKGEDILDEEKLKDEILKSLKMEGLLLKDAKIVKAMDNDMDTYSLIIPARFKKDGNFDSKSSVATEEEFELLREYVNVKMTELCTDMLSGDIKIEPIKYDKRDNCTYCEYSSICQFDTSIKDNSYKIVFKKSSDEIWNKIRKCVKGESEDGTEMD